MSMKQWIKAAAIRAVKTAAQSAIGVLGASALLTDIDWLVVLSASGFAAVLSVLTSLAGLPEVESKA
jgi:hypothetical protein